MREVTYVGYCRKCQRYVFFKYRRLLGIREIAKWRRCPYCGELAISSLQRTN